MHVALVSCGPSAAAFDPQRHPGPVVAVSKAARLFASDIWVCLDWPVFVRVADTVQGFPRLYTLNATLNTIRRRHCPWAASACVVDALACPVARFSLYTGPAALVVAYAVLGATRIDCYGVDMEGTGDVTGDPGEDRSETRWAKERAIWDGVTGWLASLGCDVVRHSPPQAPQ